MDQPKQPNSSKGAPQWPRAVQCLVVPPAVKELLVADYHRVWRVAYSAQQQAAGLLWGHHRQDPIN